MWECKYCQKASIPDSSDKCPECSHYRNVLQTEEILSLAGAHLPSGQILACAIAGWGTIGHSFKNLARGIILSGDTTTDLAGRKICIGLIGVTSEQFFVADFGVIRGTPPPDIIRSLFKEEPFLQTFPLSKLHASCTNCTDESIAGTLWIEGALKREFWIDNDHRWRNVAEGAKISNAVTPRSGEKSCFIATACWGNPDCVEVTLFRQFRDDILLRSHFGCRYVQLYYWISPPVANVLRRVPMLAAFVRSFALQPILRRIRRRLQYSLSKRI